MAPAQVIPTSSPGTSLSSSPSPTRAVTLPVLPPEIILSIIRHSLAPPTSYAAVASRYPILLVYALVCRTWRDFAQAELFAHVLLEDAAHAERFTAACTCSGALGRRTVSLRLGRKASVRDAGRSDAGNRVSGSKVLCDPVVAGMVPNIREAWLTCIPRVSLARVFGNSSELKALHLHRVNIYEPPDRQQRYLIPHLRHLSLRDCGFTLANNESSGPFASVERVQPFLAKALPPLTTFDAHRAHATGDATLDFSSSGPSECRTLTVDDHRGDTRSYWLPRLPAYTSLARLAFANFTPVGTTDTNELEELLRAVPTELDVLRLPLWVDHPGYDVRRVQASAVKLLARDLPCLRKLRRLVVCTTGGKVVRVKPDGSSGFITSKLKARCRVQGIELVERRMRVVSGFAIDHVMEEWEAFEETW